MKTISLRDFQIKPSVYINDLPITLTRFGKPIAVVSSITESPDAPQLPITSPTEIPEEYSDQEDPTLGFCKLHWEQGVKYPIKVITWEDENGNTVIDKQPACPKCVLKYETMGRGRVYFL